MNGKYIAKDSASGDKLKSDMESKLQKTPDISSYEKKPTTMQKLEMRGLPDPLEFEDSLRQDADSEENIAGLKRIRDEYDSLYNQSRSYTSDGDNSRSELCKKASTLRKQINKLNSNPQKLLTLTRTGNE